MRSEFDICDTKGKGRVVFFFNATGPRFRHLLCYLGRHRAVNIKKSNSADIIVASVAVAM